MKTKEPNYKYIINNFSELSENTLVIDGHDNAIIGLCRFPVDRIVYNIETIIINLMKTGMTDEEAWEFYYFNIQGSYLGEHTPIFISTLNSKLR